MQVFLEVIKDLYGFICQVFRDLFKGANNIKEIEIVSTQVKNNLNKYLSRPIIASTDKNGDIEGWTAYVQDETVTYYSQPILSIDTKLGSFFYGDKVIVTRTIKNFAEVHNATVRGWVNTEALTEDFLAVLPNFEHSFVYGVYDKETIKLRRLIQDEVLGGKLEVPLQSLEFVLSILKQKQLQVEWPLLRPRLPGSWKTLLRGVKGVSLSLEPHTGAILEYAGDDGISGFFGYVEAVHPDLSITLQSVGREKEGEFRIEEFYHNEWKEWRPVFISFV